MKADSDFPIFASQLTVIRMGLYNTPERIQRVDRFKVKLTVQSVNGETEPVLVFSEPLVMQNHRWEGIQRRMIRDLNNTKSIEFNLPKFERMMTLFVANLLLYCVAYFEDEVEADLYKETYLPEEDDDSDILQFD